MMHKQNKVGFFDSGLGGLSIWQECHTLMPTMKSIYLADNKNAPYGTRSIDEIIRLSIKNTEFLIERGCSLVVVACNTATTAAISTLRDRYDIPFVGIEPAIKPAAMQTKNNKVGVLATEGTLVSHLFKSTSEKFAKGVHVINQHGTGLVRLIEEGKMYSDEMTLLLEELMAPLVKADIDYLVLGCTHYPFLIPQLKTILPETVTIIDSGRAVAKRVHSLLNTDAFWGLTPKNINENAQQLIENLFFTNKSTQIMDAFMEEINISFRSQYIDF